MEKLIAHCGLDCEKCDARIATINDDNELREKTAKLWSQLNGVEITAKMINCDGCRVDGKKTPFCDSMCPIRKCSLEGGNETCGQCEKMDDCQVLGTITATNQEAIANLKKV